MGSGVLRYLLGVSRVGEMREGGGVASRSRAILAIVTAVVAACGPAVTPIPSETQASPPPLVTVGPAPTDVPSPSPSPDLSGLVPADLDGVLTTPALAHRLPLFVSIDDARAARPQSGFNATSVVWQVPVDGYESRYLMAFQELDASAIGPVRSARLFLAHWAAEAHGALAHYGGDRITRAWMADNRRTVFTDVDGLGAGNAAYHRISSRDAPHNAYTSSADLRRVALKLGADRLIDGSVHLRPFRDDVSVAERGSVQQIRIPYNTETIRSGFDAASDSYKRFIGSNPQIDSMDGQQVTARTVVVLFMPFHTDSTIEPGHNRPVLGFIGSGVAWIFSEGTLVKGRWSKAREGDPTLILGPDGQELAFVRGRIFMQVVPTGTSVVRD